MMMEVVQSIREMQQRALLTKRSGARIGFVPTMGCLHEGHLSLVKLAKERSEIVVLSIFVNPIQFLPGEDFARYPRPFEQDELLCRRSGVDILFYPEAATIYAPDHSVYVDEEKLSRGLCGGSRPGHFRGVTTVVAKLFNIVQPDIAIFGQKDAQQARVIRRMVRDLNMPVEVVLGPIIRHEDGLAMSSRNRYLSPPERQDALCLNRALREASRLAEGGETSIDRLRRVVLDMIHAVPSAKVDYIEFVDDDTLEPVSTLNRPVLLALAIRIGSTRLIDNCVLKP